MNITRDVIDDLLPLYLANEASPGSKQLVDEYLLQHPEVADEVRRLRTTATPRVDVDPPPELAMRALRRTRSLLALQRWLFTAAVTTTALSLATRVRFQNGTIVEVRPLILDDPWRFGTGLVVAAALWIAYRVVRHRSGVVSHQRSVDSRTP